MQLVTPYLTGVYAVRERVTDRSCFPLSLPWVPTLDLRLSTPVTFFVGENGSGKSTLLEAIADLSGFHTTGGGRDDQVRDRASESALARVLRPRFVLRPRDGFFFRAEAMFGFADLLDQRRDDPDFDGDPYGRYGGRSLHTRSHGEAFLAVLQSRMGDGLFLLDEPEAAFSPERQLAFLAFLYDLVRRGRTQCIIATHSPILLTFPDAVIVSFDAPSLVPHNPARDEAVPDHAPDAGRTGDLLEAPSR